MNIQLPLVSICVPNYNNASYIEQAIQSALNQTYEKVEVIVVDNLSTDNSWEIINSIHHPKLSKYQNNENIGMVGNFRKALEYSLGEYITFLCSDDLLNENAISKSIALYNKNPNLSFVFGNIEYSGTRIGSTNYKFKQIFTSGEWTKLSLSKAKNFAFLTGTIFRKEESFSINDVIADLVFFDWYLWLKLGKKEVGFISDIVGKHHYHINNQTSLLTPGYLKNYYGLKKVITLLYHESLIDIHELVEGINNLTSKYANLQVEFKNFGIIENIKQGIKFCKRESINSNVIISKFAAITFYRWILTK
jgi:glycosyltransferase involved in cell wall biosynthesis